MPSKVFFSPARGSPKRNKFDRLTELLDRAGLVRMFNKTDIVAIKTHWGELGNAGFVPSFYIHHLVSQVAQTGAAPFVTDTNTLYRGKRFNALDNLACAMANGFSFATLGAPVIIADGLKGLDYREVPVNGVHVKSARIASAVADATGILLVSHVKGHQLFGFGGALKNLGMGCAAAAAKQFLHADVRPKVRVSRCTGCGTCVRHCAFNAIELTRMAPGRTVAQIITERCQGCGECIIVCPHEAIPISWSGNFTLIMEKTAEYAAAAVAGKSGKLLCVNFLTSITPDCDCAHWSDAPIIPDIGYLVSTDPVAIDMASVHLVNNFPGFPDRFKFPPSADRFRDLHKVDYMPLLTRAHELGLGSLDFELVEL